MVWIEIINQINRNEILKEEMIENISCDFLETDGANLGFYAHVKGNKYLICSLKIYDSVSENMSTEEFIELYNNEGKTNLKKIVRFISEAKRENNDQILNLNKKFSP